MENRAVRAVLSKIRRIEVLERCAAREKRTTEVAQLAAMGICADASSAALQPPTWTSAIAKFGLAV